MLLYPKESRFIIFPFIFTFCVVLITLCEANNIYFANLHSHTAFSDGQGTPEEAFTYARDSAQIDILALTDHTHYLTENSYQHIRGIADQYTEDGKFVALNGQEFGNLGHFGHITIFEAQTLCPIATSNLAATYQWVYQNQKVTQFNHPGEGDFDYFSYDFTGDEYCSTIEIVNGSGNYTVLNEQMYLDALAKGWHLAPAANQDNHRKRWGDATTTTGQIPLTGIWADTLTKSVIINAILNLKAYATEVKPKTDRICLKGFSIDNTVMGGTYSTDKPSILIRLEVVAETGFAQIYLYKNGVIYDSVNTQNRDSIVWLKNDSTDNAYYFIKGFQVDGDRFWSAPIWVEYKKPTNSIIITPNPLKTSSKIIFYNIGSELIEDPKLEIYNIAGEKIYQTSNVLYTPPKFSFSWDGTSNDGELLPNGVYLVCVKYGMILKSKIAIER